ncbi:hypothetical protein VDBG_04856 [Verticillium alfalfae VaMs.102]|uniref:Uncharacterized protein n=1 Tax=Verticillium alfalfae (strain VaMs.102 / ATCC MYA-4576 / FGSC 10136) TaxID=526221 RepID=C9SIH4_VERA1|nr:hypothetical protein VDBG_04856 [Verticillium alfalfae VaMs.102]EEY18747.1 hypothetical protein VDBG_04856 [Verticillium alfalfae VaMs.102]
MPEACRQLAVPWASPRPADHLPAAAEATLLRSQHLGLGRGGPGPPADITALRAPKWVDQTFGRWKRVLLRAMGWSRLLGRAVGLHRPDLSSCARPSGFGASPDYMSRGVHRWGIPFK